MQHEHKRCSRDSASDNRAPVDVRECSLSEGRGTHIWGTHISHGLILPRAGADQRSPKKDRMNNTTTIKPTR
jgi:hypothetical protein